MKPFSLLAKPVFAICAAGILMASMLATALPAGSEEEPLTAPPEKWRAMIDIPDLEDQSHIIGDLPVTGPGMIYLLAEPGIYSILTSEINRYMQDIADEGWTPVLFTDGWADEMAVKEVLTEGYASGMVGALFIGSIPYAMYEMEDWFAGVNYGWTEFPIDLFFMDLDGLWIDSDFNGKYDDHQAGSGTLEPEIFVGRLMTSTLTIAGQSEAGLLADYFERNHEYRNGNMTLYNRSLVYVDDDWYPSADQWGADVGVRYSNYTLVKDKDMTTAPHYRSMLDDNYDWISLFAHSAWYYHMFYGNGGASTSNVFNSQIYLDDPAAHFYNLFCCSGADFSNSGNGGNLAGHYVFAPSQGLCAVGSTKTGSMLNFNLFYSQLAAGASIGEAFYQWFYYNGETGAGADSRAWFYGMTICGDPTLDTYDDAEPAPPTDQWLSINGNDLELTWSPSESPDVEYYNIYKSTDPDGFNFGAPVHSTLGDTDPLACCWADPSTASDETPYYYIVKAVDFGGNEDSNEVIAAKYPVFLLEGWTLMSLPLYIGDYNHWDALESIPGQYTKLMAYDSMDAADPWKVWSADKPFSMNDLYFVNNEEGYWIFCDTPDPLIITTGILEPATISLKTGWNLVGYPSIAAGVTVATAMAGLPYTEVRGFNDGAPWLLERLGPSNLMEPGLGYWIYVTSDCEWTVDW